MGDAPMRKELNLSAECRCGTRWHSKSVVPLGMPLIPVSDLFLAECPVCRPRLALRAAERLPAAADPRTWQVGQVEAWGWRPAMSAAPADCTGACGDRECNCSGEDRTVAWAPPGAGR